MTNKHEGLSLANIMKIRRLYAAGKSYKTIAIRLGISDIDVEATIENNFKANFNPSHIQYPRLLSVNSVNCKYGRCPECGCKVQVPCLACQLNKLPKGRAVLDR